jgi:hypothetical protein
MCIYNHQIIYQNIMLFMTWKRIATILSLPANPPPAKPATSRGEFIPDLVWVVMKSTKLLLPSEPWLSHSLSTVQSESRFQSLMLQLIQSRFSGFPQSTQGAKKNEIIQLGMGSSLEPLKWDFHRIPNSFKLEMTSPSVVSRVKCLSKKRLWTASRA